LRSDYGFQKMAVCEFLGCTLSELKERIKNPADYLTILHYMAERSDRIKSKMPPKKP